MPFCQVISGDPSCKHSRTNHFGAIPVCMLSHLQLFTTPWTIAHQAALSLKFSRQEYWSGLPFPTPRDLPDPGIKPTSPTSPALAVISFTTEPHGKPHGAGGSNCKEAACNAGDPGSIPGLRQYPGEGNGYTLLVLNTDLSLGSVYFSHSNFIDILIGKTN